jgi:hypothetical protein
MFAKYLQMRVAITHVNARNEDYAFDIFESLNTAGQPLTAYQTFKPRVVASIPRATYLSDPRKLQLDAIERYLQPYDKPDERHKRTAELITGFALGESGEKLGLRLSAQRRWIQKRFLEQDEEGQAAFVKLFGDTATFLRLVWLKDTKSPSVDLNLGNPDLNDRAQLCLGALRQANHTIVIPLLVRFYQAWKAAAADRRLQAAQDFVGALQAIAAFWTLWRLSRRTTDRIDDLYRKLMSEQGFARKPAAGVAAVEPSLTVLKQYLSGVLSAKGLLARQRWVDLVVQVPAYGNEYAATRLALLAASHDTVASRTDAGMCVKGRPGSNPRLTADAWRDEINLSVEHIAPQTQEREGRRAWPEDLYANVDTIEKLGNLILFPQPMNSHLSNRDWPYKHAVYSVLAAKTKDEADANEAAANLRGIRFEAPTKTALDSHAHLQQAEAIAKVEGLWTAELIDRRTKNIAELAWEELATWLGTVEDGALKIVSGPAEAEGETAAAELETTVSESGEDAGLSEEE